ncbi:MAG: DEAD/DEAH box helicase [Cyanophyceae cyanobacterium]
MRLDRLGRQMPTVCRFYQDQTPPQVKVESASRTRSTKIRTRKFNPPNVELPLAPNRLVQHFLAQVVDLDMRRVMGTLPLPGARRVAARSRGGVSTTLAIAPTVKDWLVQLGSDRGLCESGLADLMPLGTILNNWVVALGTVQDWSDLAQDPSGAQVQLKPQAQSSFRPAFKLVPPQSKGNGDEGEAWVVAVGLQSLDERSLWLGAEILWQYQVEQLRADDRLVDAPLSTLLRGLGLAARLYPVLEPMLTERSPTSQELTAAQAYEFIKTVAWRFKDSGLGVVLPPSLAERDSRASRLGLNLATAETVQEEDIKLGLSSLLDFRWSLTLGGRSLTKEQFEQILAEKDLDELPLVDIEGTWIELRPADVRAAREFFEKRQGNMSLSLEEALRISTGDSPVIDKLPVVGFEASGTMEQLLGILGNNQALEAVEDPETLTGTLRPYLRRGVAGLSFLERWGLGACLADDMGLGKSIQCLAFLLHLKEREALNGPVLLICPTSVLGNWRREAKRFAPKLDIVVHHGDKRAKGKALARKAEKSDLIMTTYALVFRDEMTLQSVPWRGVVLDEAQNIKNSDSKQSQAVRRLVSLDVSEKKAKDDGDGTDFAPPFRIALTGTPVENRLSELWSIMDFLNPGYLGQKQFFQRRFALPIEKYGDSASLQTLRSLVQPFILRRVKTDRTIIDDLPEKQEMTVFCGLSKPQAELYQALVEKSLAEIESSDGIQRHGQVLALLTKLKQLCNHPDLLTENKGAGTLPDPDLSPKLERLLAMVDELVAEGDRALIFTQFAQWGDRLQNQLANHLGEEILYLSGSTPQVKRDAMVERFQSDPQAPKILILSLKAGGVGLNLTRANHVFHFDRWWNPAVENQATDRAFRIGQTRNVQVHKFVCTGTLEEKIHDLIESKKALAEQIVGAGENWLSDLDTNGLRDLLLLDRTAALEG